MILWLGARGGRTAKSKSGGKMIRLTPSQVKTMGGANLKQLSDEDFAKAQGLRDDRISGTTTTTQKTMQKNLNPNSKGTPKASTPKTAPIKDLKEFDSEMKKIVAEYQKKEGRDDVFIPIYEVRARFGDRISRQEFDKALGEMQGADKFQMSGGEMPNSTQQKIDDSWMTNLGKIRYYIEPDFPGKSMDKKIQNRSIKQEKAVKGIPIKSGKEFTQEVTKELTQINKEFPQKGGYIEISQLRDRMKGRMDKKQFDNWLLESQRDGKYTLSDGGYRGDYSGMSETVRKGGVKTSLGKERHYIQFND